ncbi:prolyl oligopeptidase family protein [Haloactinospora alba]|uniref:Prolyl oligopeptidase family protein n=1 Tax=Haloactinospora alba TaxID=405555 RepID=A0A543NLL3_9ACTN|nr:prolyl oligopeptidase family serine peptidase [Haloactinospora alba]TQN32721.1 prolyl oligopeptidase family protein [Haloactinospora alba]
MSDAAYVSTPRSARPEPLRLTTSDGVALDASLLRGRRPETATSAVVVANGFTGTRHSPATRMVASALLPVGDVLTFDFRGHHASGGVCTVGNAEIHDVTAAVDHLRARGYTSVATVGFSMGAAVVVRHAGIVGGVAAAVSVSGPSRWYYRGTRRMRLLHAGVEKPAGRWFLRTLRGVRVIDQHWEAMPLDPTEAASAIAPAPLLVVHGDADDYFPLEHPRRIHGAAHDPAQLWIEPGMGHAERAMTRQRAQRVAGWLVRNMPDAGSREEQRRPHWARKEG